MKDLESVKKESEKFLSAVRTLEDLEKARVKITGRKGLVTLFLRSLKNLSLAKKRKIGPQAQALEKELTSAIKKKEGEIKEEHFRVKLIKEKIDVTRPGIRSHTGSLHPLTQVEKRAVNIFENMGFEVAEGPDIETGYYNFDALNIPADHPARDLWDTFWLKPQINADGNADKRGKYLRKSASNQRGSAFLLRTHTSPVQVRYMEKNPPPLKIVVPGTAFRYEAIDATHNVQFLQLEGLLVDKKVSVANFKAVIGDFFSQFLAFRAEKKQKVKIRLRPSYFPFVEPGFEVDVWLEKPRRPSESGSRPQASGWLEMMGAGMVHPNVFKNAGLNPKDWQGFAFGLGIDRLAMVHYGIDDIRLFYQNDMRFLKQF